MNILKFFKMSAMPNEDKAVAQSGSETENKETDNTVSKVKVHNLIILDQSGSMWEIYQPALTGVNETLQTIREAQKEHVEQEHSVTLVPFSSVHFKQIYFDTPAEKAVDITKEQYQPCGNTPLYDAMGQSITKLRKKVEKGDIVLVTIITDGYENFSREYTGQSIKQLVEEMRSKGWIFTYIGANQDVEAVAASMSIQNHLEFSTDEESTREMFEKERKARKKFNMKVSKLTTNREVTITPSELMGFLEKGYFDED